MDKEERKKLWKAFLPMIIIGLVVISAIVGVEYHRYQSEKERLANLTPEEIRLEEQAKREEEKRKEEARKKAQESDRAFDEEMAKYNSGSVEYTRGVRDKYAEFTLTDVALGEKYVFGKDLPTGSRGHLYMSGRGSSGVGKAGSKR